MEVAANCTNGGKQRLMCSWSQRSNCNCQYCAFCLVPAVKGIVEASVHVALAGLDIRFITASMAQNLLICLWVNKLTSQRKDFCLVACGVRNVLSWPRPYPPPYCHSDFTAISPGFHKKLLLNVLLNNGDDISLRLTPVSELICICGHQMETNGRSVSTSLIAPLI